MKYLLRLVAPLLLGALSAVAQVGPVQDGTPSIATASVPLTYTGGDSRVSVGVDQDGHTEGELMQVFGNNGEHAVVAQLWWGHAGAGGVQADYNWLWGTSLDQVRSEPDSATVAKLSFAVDQNAERDRQANVGLAVERKEFFVNLFLSGKASGSRNAGAQVNQQHSVLNGTDDIGIYTQTQTDIATTVLEAQPYSYTVGMHGGHFSDTLTARFNGGFDYSKGHQGANQSRVSIGVDKFLGTRGWSVSGLAEHLQSNDPVETNRTDNRWWLFLRYEFGGGGAFRQLDGDATGSAATAWIQRALHEPVTGHQRNIETYTTRGKTTTTTSQGPKQYTARRPIARDDTASIAGNSAATAIGVLANDSDPDGNALSITAVTTPSNGTAQISGDHVLYTPTTGFVGADQFSYTITNTKGLTASAKVLITVTAAIPPPTQGVPIARDDTATTPYATPVAIAVLANDSDPNGYPLSVTSVTAPAHGTARINADGSVTYTPSSTYVGADRFSYSISNGHGGSASANVTLTVLPPLPPVARDDSATTPFSTPIIIDVLANDSDPNGFFLTVTSVGVATNGTAKVVPGGAVSYSPQAGFVGTDSFQYSISNGHGGIASANVTVTVQPPGGSLTAQNDTATTPYAKPVAINVIANDTAPSGLALTVTKVTLPAHGAAQIAINGFIDYTPLAVFDGGSDTFDYTVTDGLTTTTATVTVTVLPPPPPVAQNDIATTPFQTPVTINVLANDSDPSGLPLKVTQTTIPSSGTVMINTTSNTITYTPDIEFDGNATFNYTISNGHGGTATATVSVNVLAPLPPIAGPDSATTPFNTPVTINVLANDSDPKSLPLTILQPGFPLHGSAVLNTNNTITYKPQSGFHGVDTFIYVLQNSQGAIANGYVTVTVQDSLPPVAVPDTKTTAFNTPIDIDVLANDSDPNNGVSLSLASFTQPTAGGTVQANTNNTLKFTPAADFTGDATFTYTVTDQYRQASATVTVTVEPPPAATAVSFDVPAAAGCSYGGEICAVCLDTHIMNPSSLVLTLSVSPTTPGGGNVLITSVGGCINGVQYQSSGSSKLGDSDSFTFTVKDKYDRSSTGTARVGLN